MTWIDEIKQRKSKSTAILARRKMGKTALIERLFNITFHKNDGVIPFYYEIREETVDVVDFCLDFFLTFIYQYMAFKSRKREYLGQTPDTNFDKVKETVVKEGLDYLIDMIEKVEYTSKQGHGWILWNIVREAPKNLAASRDEFIVQMIDEFQFMNALVYRDKTMTRVFSDMAGGYLSAAESKVAPLLVTGSWVGWLLNDLMMLLPGRFRFKFLRDMPEEEAVEMTFKYSRFFDVSVTEETAYLIAQLSEGSPFYISAIIRSTYEDKDLTTVDGLADTLEFETLRTEGEIKSTWMEYVSTAFHRVNDRQAKNIVLYLSKNKNREVTRRELLEKLELEYTDAELEKKLKALVRADIIEQGASNFRYRGVQDNIFGKVFRGVYQEEIEAFESEQIRKEYLEAFEELKKKYRSLLGKFSYQKGYFAEYLILDQLLYHARSKNVLLKEMTCNLPADFKFCEYRRVWSYRYAPGFAEGFSVDIFAPAQSSAEYSIVGEVKSRDRKAFSKAEAQSFEKKLERMVTIEKLDRVVGFIFSRSGLSAEAEEYCRKRGISYSADERWLDI